MNLIDPFTLSSMQEFNVGTMICEYLKNLVEDYINSNRTICTCTDLDHLLLIINKLEITYMLVNGNGDVDGAGAPMILG
jgi:hypothetical protein